MAVIALMNLFVCLLKKILADMNRPSVNCRQLWIWAVFVKNRVVPGSPSQTINFFDKSDSHCKYSGSQIWQNKLILKHKMVAMALLNSLCTQVWDVATKVALKNDLWNVCMSTICLLRNGRHSLQDLWSCKRKPKKTFVAMETTDALLESSNHKYHFSRQRNDDHHHLKCKDFFCL